MDLSYPRPPSITYLRDYKFTKIGRKQFLRWVQQSQILPFLFTAVRFKPIAFKFALEGVLIFLLSKAKNRTTVNSTYECMHKTHVFIKNGYTVCTRSKIVKTQSFISFKRLKILKHAHCSLKYREIFFLCDNDNATISTNLHQRAKRQFFVLQHCSIWSQNLFYNTVAFDRKICFTTL